MSHNHAPNNSYLARTTSLPSSTNFTVSMWVRCSGGTGTWRAFFQLVFSGGDIWIGGGTANNIELWVGPGGSGVVVSSTLTLNTWYWVGLVSSSATNRVGYASVEQGTISQGTQTYNSSGASTEIRVGNSIYNEPCECEIMAVKIWDAALTLNELRAERSQIYPKRWANLHLWSPCWNANDVRDYGPAGRNWGFTGTIVTGANPPIPYILKPSRRPRLSSGNNIYTHTATGGMVLDGGSNQSLIRDFVPSGGVTLGGNANLGIIRDFVPSGGMTFGGDANLSIVRNFIPTGGLILGGAGLVSTVFNFIPSGGIVFNGAADAVYVGGQNIYEHIASGGFVLAGDAAYQKITSFIASGGFSLAGSAIPTIIRVHVPSGGLILSGAAVNNIIRSFTPAGGITLGGEAIAGYINAGIGTRYSLSYIFNLQTRLDVKEITDSGEVQANASDPNGTPVTFNKTFRDVRAITVSLKNPTSNYIVTFDFQDVPNPTGFKVYVWNTSGTRVSATVNWIVRGV
jgi:hypothetical protein